MVGHGHRLDLVVRDVDHGDAESTLQSTDFATHLTAQLRIQVGQRLVHEADRRLGDDRAAERNALLLSARELRRFAIEKLLKPEQIGGTRAAALDVRRA